ncbi:MAG: hypothetical protein R3242_08710 [Akkermansiaceae bacterium]|nr:hypothetical protein [Akkermansiaceae bacterium]
MIARNPAIHVLTLLFILGLCACDKVKEVTSKVSEKVSETLEEKLEDSGPEDGDEPAPLNPLQMLADKNEEGVIFRKDLEFPSEIEVETTAKRRISGRVFHRDETGERVVPVQGVETIVAMYESDGSGVDFTIKETAFTVPRSAPKEGESGIKEGDNPLRHAPPYTETVRFVKKAGEWKSSSRGDFRKMSFCQDVAPAFGDLLVENGLRPRPLWFANKRIQIGDELTISDKLLPMLVTGTTDGSLTIKLEEFDALDGHPCGVFSVTGDYVRKGFPDPDGVLVDQEVTVESGRMWLSAIFPVILRKELTTIQSFEPTQGGGLVGRGQGKVEIKVERSWKAEVDVPELKPEAEAAQEPTEGNAGDGIQSSSVTSD